MQEYNFTTAFVTGINTTNPLTVTLDLASNKFTEAYQSYESGKVHRLLHGV